MAGDFEGDDEFLAHMRLHCPQQWKWTTVERVASDLQTLGALLECHLEERFEQIFGWAPRKLYTDYYDGSAEIHGMPEGFLCTDAMREAMGAMGFRRFWLHVDHERRRQPGEQAHGVAATAQTSPPRKPQ